MNEVTSPRSSVASNSPRHDWMGPRKSQTSSKRSTGTGSNNDGPNAVTVPFYVTLLEGLIFDVDVTKQGHDVRYVLRVRRDPKCTSSASLTTTGSDTMNNNNNNHNNNNSGSGLSDVSSSPPVTIRHEDAWSLSRSFDEYRTFRKKVVKLLNHGHFCSAECPWLFTFLTNYFPRNHVFRNSSQCVMQSRQSVLKKFFQTFQTFLCAKQNQCCGLLMDVIAKELVAFVYGDLVALQSPLASQAFAAMWQRPSFSDSVSDEEDTTNVETISSCSSSSPSSSTATLPVHEEMLMVCPLCDSSLHEVANSGIKSIAPHFQDATRRFSRSYITRLGCGHLFHDECIVPKLNESLRCPTCGRDETS